MPRLKTVHLCHFDKFIPPFIAFVRERVDTDHQRYYLFGDTSKHDIKLDKDIIDASGVCAKAKLVRDMNCAGKIIIHGLFDKAVLLLLFFQPWLFKKCRWVIWGGDLYRYPQEKATGRQRIQEFMRAVLIRNIGYLVALIPGDFALAKSAYKARGAEIRSFVYPSNLYKKEKAPVLKREGIRILAGNSAAVSNNHAHIFEKIHPFKDKILKIYCPLSYGDPEHARAVSAKGKALFDEKFEAMTDFIPPDEYHDFLSAIDIGIFAHTRQQSLGNIITLLGLGKKIYLSKESPIWEFFTEQNIKVFDLDYFDLNLLSEKDANENNACVKALFSEQNLCRQLKEIVL